MADLLPGDPTPTTDDIGQLAGTGDQKPAINKYLRFISYLLEHVTAAVPTGTGLRKIVGGVENAAASLIVNADVDAAANIAQSKIAGLSALLATLAVDSTVVHITGAQVIAGLKQFTTPPVVPTPSGGTDATNKDWVETYVASQLGPLSGPIGAGVADAAALRAIDTTAIPDKQIRLVEDLHALYSFDSTGTGADDGNLTIDPTTGPGRWFKSSTSTLSHSALTGLQGGTSGEYYHLTAAQRDDVLNATDASTAGTFVKRAVSGIVSFLGLRLEGPIRFTTEAATVLFHRGTPSGAPIDTGFRFKNAPGYLGVAGDYFVFEKIDAENLDPAGGFAWSMTGSDGVEYIAAYLNGAGILRLLNQLQTPLVEVRGEADGSGQIIRGAGVIGQDSTFLRFRRSEGTLAAPVTLSSGYPIARIIAEGYDGAAFVEGGQIRFQNTQGWNPGAHGGCWIILATPNGGTGDVEALRIFADGVVIGGTALNAKAILQADSTTRGFLGIPRMTTTQKTALGTPTQPIQVFDTTLNKYQWFDVVGAVWTDFGAGGGGGGGATLARATVVVTTASIANLAISNIAAVMGKTAILQAIEVDRAAWVRVYNSVASRTADATRDVSEDPPADSGCMVDQYLTAAGKVWLNPSPTVVNAEAAPTSSLACAIANRSGGASTVQVTFTFLALE